jgi:hypothetical protein
MRYLYTLFLASFAYCALLAPAWAEATAAADREIQQLLEFVQRSGCDFERNGTVHDSANAADHLRLKYSRGSRYVSTAEQFIDRLASKSSWSGKAYTVTCEGQVKPAGPWLHGALDNIRDSKPDASQHE